MPGRRSSAGGFKNGGWRHGAVANIPNAVLWTVGLFFAGIFVTWATWVTTTLWHVRAMEFVKGYKTTMREHEKEQKEKKGKSRQSRDQERRDRRKSAWLP